METCIVKVKFAGKSLNAAVELVVLDAEKIASLKAVTVKVVASVSVILSTSDIPESSSVILVTAVPSSPAICDIAAEENPFVASKYFKSPL